MERRDADNSDDPAPGVWTYGRRRGHYRGGTYVLVKDTDIVSADVTFLVVEFYLVDTSF